MDKPRYRVLLEAAWGLLWKQVESDITLNLLNETVEYDGTDCDGHCLIGDISSYLVYEDKEEHNNGIWNMLDRNDQYSYPPTDEPLFIAYKKGDEERIEMGITGFLGDKRLWLITHDNDDDGDRYVQIEEEQVVAWISKPTKFPVSYNSNLVGDDSG